MADERVEVIELVLSEHQLLSYAMMAHEEDITLNQWFLNAILSYCDTMKDETDVKANSDK